jgi:hypothetical protein
MIGVNAILWRKFGAESAHYRTKRSHSRGNRTKASLVMMAGAEAEVLFADGVRAMTRSTGAASSGWRPSTAYQPKELSDVWWLTRVLLKQYRADVQCVAGALLTRGYLRPPN